MKLFFNMLILISILKTSRASIIYLEAHSIEDLNWAKKTITKNYNFPDNFFSKKIISDECSNKVKSSIVYLCLNKERKIQKIFTRSEVLRNSFKNYEVKSESR